MIISNIERTTQVIGLTYQNLDHIEKRARGMHADLGPNVCPYGYPSVYAKVYNNRTGKYDFIWHKREITIRMGMWGIRCLYW